ncbi:polysaccharide deacetylase family protein [Haloprofundus salilacus]|uniref:polysaccharide deacetylase family protein n=1 Tax=Haloprofundus salilacus TaxID=2876190 RepID=UPI001CC98EFA|nr:polysaccharide deacetylase family protein [Haloprofundus salilacus]
MVGTITISIEIELAWGVHDLGEYDHLSEGCQQERVYLRKLLDKCDELDIAISFDIVGHLLLDSCDGHECSSYPSQWFTEDPATDHVTNPEFYAPDIADEILSRPTDHELCTHTFSHALSNQMDAALISEELARSQRLHERVVGEPTVSLVPPRHHLPPETALKANSIEIVRQAVQTRGPTPLHRYKELLLGQSFTRKPRLVDGIVETYCTYYPSLTAPALPAGQRETHALFKWQPLRLRQRLHERRLKATVESVGADDSYLHLWCHLYDLSNEHQWRPLAAFLEALAKYRDDGSVSVETMEQLNAHVRKEAVDRRHALLEVDGASEPDDAPEADDVLKEVVNT